MLEGIDVFVAGLGLVGVMVTVAVWVLVLLTVEQPTRKMKEDRMMRMIVRSIYLRICSLDMRVILKEPGNDIANTNQTHRYQGFLTIGSLPSSLSFPLIHSNRYKTCPPRSFGSTHSRQYPAPTQIFSDVPTNWE